MFPWISWAEILLAIVALLVYAAISIAMWELGKYLWVVSYFIRDALIVRER